ncbi:PAC2 family protein [Aestuariimicrobium kwangyangense]|uniref:PAC2 family protein n=1 Tax=Aestuariimicrobium kwangyangense TaxID=396389 RepID=UPI0003B73A55|nr:PAC2 family protein [Aestuariimicrobium kwangyangense]
MLDPASLYQIEPRVDPRTMRARTLVVTLTSFMDAGRAQGQFDHHVLTTLPHQRVAEFDLDQLVDYRGQRPPITFDADHFVDYEPGRMLLHHLLDEQGAPWLLLSGPEPDLQWERLARSIAQLVEQFDVQTVVLLSAIPMAAPHTRPVSVTRHASDPSLIPGNVPMFPRVQMSASFPSMLELRLAELGHKVVGLTAHVPHYLAQAEYPDATIALIRALSETTGHIIPTTALAVTAEQTQAQVADEVQGSDEAQQLVQALEEQYDQVHQHRPRRGLAAQPEDLPDGDALAREAEAFLRAHNAGDEGEQPDRDQPEGWDGPGV